jgi:hypothetical protein
MKRKKTPLRGDLLRRAHQTIAIIFGVILLFGALLSYMFLHYGAKKQDPKNIDQEKH